ncbi:MAG: hypothetical protein H7Z17_14060, partial [Fuerstia sp.]|nr:hypothetical protein [Fuerstiella sp.]
MRFLVSLLVMIIVVTRLSCAFPADDRDERSHRIVTDLLYRSDDDTLTD